MGLETGPHCTPTFEGSWLRFLYAFYILFRSLSPQTLISDHHLSPMLSVSPAAAAAAHSAPAYLYFAFLGFLIFRKLCQLLIALDSWALSLRSQALRKNPEIQAQRP